MHIGSEYAAKNKLQADVAALVPDMLHNVLTNNPEWMADRIQMMLDALNAKHRRCKPLRLSRHLDPADFLEYSFLKFRHQNLRVTIGEVCTIYFYEVNGTYLNDAIMTGIDSIGQKWADAYGKLVLGKGGGDV